MCHIYSHADPILYECRTRSIRIDKVVTSIKLENLFWETLSEIAYEDCLTTNQLIVNLYNEVYDFREESFNFTSFLRVTCMRYLEVKLSATHATNKVLTSTSTNKLSFVSDVN